jgi:hypothetical protein
MPLGIGKFACTINGDKQGELALFRADLRDVDMDVAQGLGLELLLRGLIAFHLWQGVDAMPLQAAMEGGSGQMRQHPLQRIQAVSERE